MAGGVELATAYVTLIPSLKGAKGKIGEQVAPEAESAGASFAQRFGSVAMSGLKLAAAAGAAAMVAATKAALENYADYEQLVGGVETLFADAADTVMANAEQAFQTAGLSANQYMETVTGMSASLIQSLGGDTEQAAQMADMAIRDMADNANKMGTDMESIQNAYQGFAKQNYTMLDNLKLGYGGTKEEMERLLAEAEKISGVHYDIDSYSDIVEAIHVVQTEMGISGLSAEEAAEMVASGAMTEEEAFEAMGTTAKEASTTIEGSMNMAKAAWSNLVTHLMDENADVGALLGNVFSSLGTVAANVGPRILTMVQQVTSLMPSLSGALTGVLSAVVAAIPEVLPLLASATHDLFGGMIVAITAVMPEVATALSTTLTQLISQLPAAVPEMLAGALTLLGSIGSAVVQIGSEVIPVLADVLLQLANQLVAAAPGMLAAAGQFIAGLPAGIGGAVGSALTAIGEVLNGVLNAISGFDLVSAGKNLIQGLINGIQSMAGAVWNAVTGAVQGAIDGALSILGIASPSRLFREIGQYTMEGMAIGIERTAAEARAAMLGATSGVVGAADMSLAATTEVGGMPAGVVYNVIFNDARVNDNEAIRAEVDAFVLDMVRRADQ